ncbi:hypothetical protein ACJZTR_02115 [Neorickettsia risticii]|uniref:Uncharacterized protein n=1 Tax=Neorickettsia risticii (strain Illinois) TaxID=434131 RepID=C6V4Z9_NEORI|nr:hypothetical protein [Neorickettsia risticii]ACT69464.1 conserved hypothetical protein [Neorickettsia risticii str. Illinois]
MQGQENRLVSYLTHGGCTYKLLQKGSNLTLEVENSSGQKASVNVDGVDSSSFTPKLDPLSKSNTAQVALTFKEAGKTFKSSVYLYDSSKVSLTEQGSGYTHPGKLLNINVCGPVNREKLCAVYDESGVIKVQVLSVNSDTGAIVSSGTSKTVKGLENRVTAISAAEVGRGQRIVILAKDGTTLKRGSSTGSSITMSTFTPTGGLSGNKVEKIILNACKENKVCAIVSCADGKLYYLKSGSNDISNAAAEIMSSTGNTANLSVDPEYDSGSTVARFNVFVTEGEGSVKKATFAITGNQCEKSNSVTVTEEISTVRPLTATTDQAGRESTEISRAVTTSQIAVTNSSREFRNTNRAITSASTTTQKTTTSVVVRRKNITPHTSSKSNTASRTPSSKRRATKTTDITPRKPTPIALESSSTAFYTQANARQLFGDTTVGRGSTSTTVAPSNAGSAGAVLGMIAGGVFFLLLLGFLWLIHRVCRRRARMRHLLEAELSALAMENLNPSEDENSDTEIPGPLQETSTERGPENHNQK